MAMRMPVVDVGVMRVRVHQRFMRMRVGVRRGTPPVERMGVLVMRIVAMPVAVLQRLVAMGMFMPLPDMQPDAQPHQHGGQPEPEPGRLGPECE